jgi:hypothetical protein
MVEQAKAQYLGCFGYREHLEEPLLPVPEGPGASARYLGADAPK